ncbi:Rieske (2Fe-2S) protein [Candidatus Endoriftia persephonae]|uniref:Rieske (2Fe-2S) iron-sulfur domain protein n=2 Tax=Gammaproteobacteria TaxID=1236 RepID=G2FDZ4_9GAMM|nr:Rieske (2Fe-2S) protein [Candidatus Endoriftia persephone]EGW54978.1 rieske (2Fe-2S) iron-sulfur domain protein [endosymbiont of Tevnia jerichonana (vent Tica)]USF87867.1 Rieske (2Fe-2S) protein [Candidatus Endoriftia persephone]
MAEPRKLCPLDMLQDPGSRGFSVDRNGRQVELFLVRRGASVFAYLNRCPHTGVNLEWLPDQFLDLSGGFVQCATHGALFRLEDGYCVRGPCGGASLQPLQAWVEADEVWVALD